jgi:hypothetical protein
MHGYLARQSRVPFHDIHRMWWVTTAARKKEEEEKRKIMHKKQHKMS